MERIQKEEKWISYRLIEANENQVTTCLSLFNKQKIFLVENRYGK